jgi:hypothetical protein
VNSYYIYYKVAPERAERLRLAVADLQRALGAATGVQGRLLCRRDRQETWMEVYEEVGDPALFEDCMERELQRIGFADLLGSDSPRRSEIFQPL